MTNLHKTLLISSIFFVCLSMDAQTNKAVKETVEIKSDVESTKIPNHDHVLLNNEQLPTRNSSLQSKPTSSGVRGAEIIGEGQYLNQDKVIMEKLISGHIPNEFPKHVVGQTPDQYKEVVMNWAKNNTHLIKPEYHHEIK